MLGRNQAGRHHLVAGKRTGLVSADHRDRAERLDGGQASNDGVPPRHRLNPHGQRDRQHGRKPFGDRGNRQPDHGHEQFREWHVSDKVAIGQQTCRNEQDEERKPAGKHIRLPQKRRGQRLDTGQHVADPADLGRRSGCHHDAARRPRNDECAAEQHRRLVAQCHLFPDRVDALVHGNGLTGQDGFLGLETPGLDQPQVCRNAIARIYQDDVAGNEIGRVYRSAVPVPQDCGVWSQHVPNGFHCPLGAALLKETDHGIHKDYGHDDAGIDPVLQGRRHDCGADQHVDQHIVEVGEEPQHRAAFFRLRRPVRAVYVQPARGFLGTQPIWRRRN